MFSLNRGNVHDTNSQAGLLKRIVILRAAVIVCLVPALWVVHFVLDKPLDLISLGKVFALALIISVVSYIWYRRHNSTDRSVFAQLLFDALLTALIVYFSGRSANPFIYYWLVLVAISATVFVSWASAIYTGVTIALYTLMLYLDVHEHLHHASEDFQLHLIGMWINFVGSAILVTFFISRLATALKNQQALLTKAREETLKNEQLVGIGTLAASTVHALGTPLSTLSLLTEELQEEINNRTENNNNDIASTMQTQILRCKQTLSKLTALAEKQNQHPQPVLIGDFIQEIIDHYDVVGATPAPAFMLPNTIAQRKILHNLLLNHALINVIDNAIHAANERVFVTLSAHDQLCIITIEDDGPGLPEHAFQQWGELQLSQKNEGLGIGVFLANSTIEKLGGAILLNNKTTNTNTSIKIQLPLWREN